MPLVKKVISGGQAGADVAALMTARMLNIPTGGTMPYGFKTIHGNKPEYRRRYHMRQHASQDYPPRTKDNVFNSDATLRIARNFSTPGEQCTLKYILALQKPYLDIKVHERMIQQKNGTLQGTGEFFIRIHPDTVRRWAQHHKVSILNIAGNADPRLEPVIIKFLTEVLK